MDSSTEGADESDSFEWFLSRCFHDEYKTIPIRKKCLTLGRGEDMGLQFCPKTYNYLSRNHCMVQILDGKPVITDCNSARGTFVNSKRLDKFSPGRIELKEGDLVGIGHKNDEIQQYFKFHSNILKYRVCRKIRDDEAVIISDDETDTGDNPITLPMVTATPAESMNESTSDSDEIKICIPKATSPVPGPSGLRLSACVSIPMELLKKSSFEAEYDMCARRLNEVCYESDTEPCAPEVVDDIITLSDDDDDEYADLHHTQMVLEEVKKELADIEKQTTCHNICDDTNVQWTLKLKSDVDATQRYKQSKELQKKNGSSKKEKADNKATKSSDKKQKQKSSKLSTGKENTKQSSDTKGKLTDDDSLKISLKRNSNDWVIANNKNEQAKKSHKSTGTLAINDAAVEGNKNETTDEPVKEISKTLVQEQPKSARKRRHSVADWNELGARKPNGTIEIAPPDNHQYARGTVTHRAPLWMTSSSADPKATATDPKPATAVSNTSTVAQKPTTTECSHSATGDKDSAQNSSKPVLKRRGSIASPEEMHAQFQKKFKPRTYVPDKIFDFHPINPSIKEQREQRKNRLIEVNNNKKNQEKTTSANDGQPVAPKKTGSTKPKVKFTPNNRGMFLTAPIPPPPLRASSTSRPTSTDESIMCTQSTTLDQLPQVGIAEDLIDKRPKKLTFESVARVSNVDRPVPGGSGLKKIIARRYSVGEPPTFLNRPQKSGNEKSAVKNRPQTSANSNTAATNRPQRSANDNSAPTNRPQTSANDNSAATNRNTAINMNRSATTRNITTNNSTNSNVSHSSRVVAPYAPLVQRLALKSILKPCNPNITDAQRKSVTIMENLNKTKLCEKYIIASPCIVREHVLCHEQNLLSEILRWSPQWLIHQQSETSRNSPFTTEDKMMPKLEDYENYESFRKLHIPFLKRELWNEVKASSRSMPFFLIARTVSRTVPKRTDLCEIECEVSINAFEQQQSAAYDFGIMEYHISPQQKMCWFFYLHTQRPLMTGENGQHNSGSHSARIMKYFLFVAGDKLERLEIGRNVVLRPFARIFVCLRRGNALATLKFSPLLCNILTPSFNVTNILRVANRTERRTDTNYKMRPHMEPGTLNPCQMKVLSLILDECFCQDLPTISIIQGPPGTGKSRVISHLVLQLMRIARSTSSKMKVLVCASSNTAVDVIVKKILNFKTRSAETSNLKVVRTGSKNKVESSCMQVYIDKLIQDKMDMEYGHDRHRNNETTDTIRPSRSKEEIKTRIDILNEADIVCTTLGSCSMLATYSLDMQFNVCIIDEATQCTELCTLLPLQYNISKLVLVGDIHQLPATVLDQESIEAGFQKSLFSRLYQSYIDMQKMDEMKILNTQYRMHPDICHWPNEYFYQRQLKNAPCTEAQRNDIPLKPYMVISLSYDQELTQAQHEIYNKDEIRFVVGLVKQIVASCSKHASFAIITPYARHKEELIQTLRNLKLQRVEAHSIDSVQGKEFDVVIISLARSNGAGFLDQPERINVAMTRARKCLVLCGNFNSLRYKPVWSSLLADAQQRKVYYQLEDHDAHAYGEQMVKNIMQRLRKDCNST